MYSFQGENYYSVDRTAFNFLILTKNIYTYKYNLFLNNTEKGPIYNLLSEGESFHYSWKENQHLVCVTADHIGINCCFSNRFSDVNKH